jgi:AcrR family transcriptional regulator
MNPPTSAPSIAEAPHEHRSRLLQGMASVVVEKAFADITVADIVRAAGVSKRSFYEHFDSKESCFLALYSAASASALRTLEAAVSPDQPWQDQIELGLNAYLSTLAAGPGLVRALFIDIHYLGEAGARARRAVMQALADFMLHSTRSATPLLPPALAMAAVGAINELILQAIESDRVAQLAELTQPASALVRRLTGAAFAPEKNPDRM